MVFPVTKVKEPAALNGVANGKIPASLLKTTVSLHGGQPITLLIVAARAFVAMRAAAEKAGVRLEAISSYRTYVTQVALFTERYVPHFAVHTSGKVVYRMWNDGTGLKRWYHAFGPTTAVPGTSNHGRGLAIDFIVGNGFIDWMMVNAVRFGWSWEIQEENWHLHYFAGDTIPQAVLDYEASLNPTPPVPDPEEDDMPKPMLCRFGTTSPNILYIDPDNVVRAVPRDELDGYKLKQQFDGASPDVCPLAKRNADGTFSHKDPNIVALTEAIVSFPYVGSLHPGWAVWWKGPKLTG